jgi:hypothetical protein
VSLRHSVCLLHLRVGGDKVAAGFKNALGEYLKIAWRQQAKSLIEGSLHVIVEITPRKRPSRQMDLISHRRTMVRRTHASASSSRACTESLTLAFAASYGEVEMVCDR